MNLVERIKAELEEKGWSVTQLAKRAGIAQPTLHRILSGDTREPKASNIDKIAKALRVDPEWLRAGSITQKPDSNAELTELIISDHDAAPGFFEVEVPYFEEIELAAGDGRIDVIESTDSFKRFTIDTLTSAGVNPHSAACARVKGTSMEPLIPNGATVAIDKSFTQIIDGEIYAINHGGMLRIKKLFRMPMNRVRIVSENDLDFPEEVVSGPELEYLKVIGRVFWWEVTRRVPSF